MGWRALALTLALLAPLAGAEPSGAQAAIPPFLLTASVGAPGALHDEATLGVSPDATSGYDRGLDAPEPPPPPGGAWLSAYLLAPNASERLSRSLEAPAPSATWTLRVDADGPAGALRVAWNASELAAFPETFTLNATWQGETFDLRDEPTLDAQKGDGPASLEIAIAIEPMWGSAPGAPANLSALPGPSLGQVSLSWTPPADDGGHPLRGYVVYRGDDGSPLRPVARVSSPAWTDSGLPLGGRYQYAVAAANRLGEGNLSAAAFALGTGKPTLLDPRPAGPGERDAPVLEVDAPLPSGGAWLPLPDAPLAEVHGHPDVIDPREYRVDAAALGLPLPEATVFTGAPLVPVDLAVPLPASGVDLPPGGAHVEVDLREAGGSPEAVILRTSAQAGPLAWDDATALP